MSASTILLCKVAMPYCGRFGYRSEYSPFRGQCPTDTMQPETYLLRFFTTEVKTPTNFVNQIFFAFFPHPKTGKKERKISAQSQLTFIVPPPFALPIHQVLSRTHKTVHYARLHCYLYLQLFCMDQCCDTWRCSKVHLLQWQKG